MISSPGCTARFKRFTSLLVLALFWLAGPVRPTLADAPGPICQPPLEPVELVNPTLVTDCSTPAQLQTALANGGQIAFACGPDPVTIILTSPLITSATEDIVLDGGGLVTLDGNHSTRLLEKPFTPNAHIDKSLGNDLTIQNMRFINGQAPAAESAQDGQARGGALWVTSPGTRLHLINTTFEHNRTTSLTDEDNQGGAVYAANIYETVIVGSVFEDNEAGSGGGFGGIATGLIVYNSRFTNNRAADDSENGIVRGHGGAIHLDGVTNSFNPDSNKVIDICGTRFEANTAIRGGGAIKATVSDNKGTKATYQYSTFSGNRVEGGINLPEGHGGAIYHIEDDPDGGDSEDNIEIRASTFDQNYAYRQGGGAWILVRGYGRIINSTFTQNEASQDDSNRVGQGGGLILSTGLFEIINTTLARNFATFQGGAIFAGSSAQVTLTNTLFDRNHLDPDHTNPDTSRWQGYHTNRPLQNGGNNLQYPRTKEPDFDNTVNNFITTPESAILFTDPHLEPLADNGGPNRTMALPAGSPAVDAGNPATCPATDQRGLSRPQGSECDIGAYERVVALGVSPGLVAIDEGEASLTVTGDGFTGSSQVLWNGVPLPTTFVDSTRLLATAGSAVIGSTPGPVSITVSDSSLPAATVQVVESIERLYLPVVVKD